MPLIVVTFFKQATKCLIGYFLYVFRIGFNHCWRLHCRLYIPRLIYNYQTNGICLVGVMKYV